MFKIDKIYKLIYFFKHFYTFIELKLFYKVYDMLFAVYKVKSCYKSTVVLSWYFK